ncbi:MAG: hypothetical protein MJA83_05130 [Gammaproteobacteria bacterium]|nr:hypothetical protein [Gammaproteobacteria bacterium]
MKIKKFSSFLFAFLFVLPSLAAADNADTLWVSSDTRLIQFSLDTGEPLRENDGDRWINALHVDSNADTAFFVRSNNLYSLEQDNSGIDGVYIPELCTRTPSGIAVDSVRKHVWAVRCTTITLYDYDGNILKQWDFPEGNVRDVSMDETSGFFWIATIKRVYRIKESWSRAYSRIKFDTHTIQDVDYDPAHDAVWVLTDKVLRLYNKTGKLKRLYSTKHYHGLFDDLSVEPENTGKLWLIGNPRSDAPQATQVDVDSDPSDVFFTPFADLIAQDGSVDIGDLKAGDNGGLWMLTTSRAREYDAGGAIKQEVVFPEDFPVFHTFWMRMDVMR